MIRVLVSLSSILSLVAADRAAVAMPLPVEAPTLPAINCEQPANTTAAPAPASGVDKSVMSTIMRQIAPQAETLSQMEAWWRERSKFGHEPQEPLAQMDAWWRERTDLHNGIASEQSPSAMKEAIAQMDAWWQQRARSKKPAPASHHRHH